MAKDGKSPATAPKSRLERRREDTRRRLMRATYEMIAARGLEGLVIQDITETADVGYGSFYNHFSSKEAIIDAVVDAALAQSAAIYDNLSKLTSDRVKGFAMELRACLKQSQDDRVWGWFILKTMLSGGQMRIVMGQRLKRAIENGVTAGIFQADDVEMARHSVGGLLMLGTLKIVNNEVSGDYPERLAATVLRSLGVSAQKIESVLREPLPDLAAPPFLAAA